MTRRVLVSFALSVALSPPAGALGTAFTYQGRLVDGSGPGNGVYDFELKLFDSAGGPTQVGNTIEVGDVNVAGGLFNVTVDFGALAFDGNDRWLQIGVRPGASAGAYTTLAPRQSLSATPYSQHAGNASKLGGVAASGYVLVGSVIPVSSGGTGASTVAGARANLGAAASGANSDITSLAGLTTPLSVAQGGTGGTTAAAARTSLGAQAEITGACPPGMTIRDVNVDGTVVCAADSLAQAGFARNAPDGAGDVGQWASIAIGADGLGLISYHDSTNAALKVAHCNDAACTGATTYTLDSTGNVGYYTSITIGTDGLGLISYWDGSNGDLKVAHCNDTACTSATTYTLDSMNNVGWYTSITIGADGLGLISYYDVTNGDLRVAHCSDTACSSAPSLPAASTGNVGQYTSITIGADGLGLISFYDATNGDLRVAHCQDAACFLAPAAILDVTGLVGQYTSITIGADGLGLISYYDATNGDLKVAHCSNTACTTATPFTLDSAGSVGEYTSITIGADGLGIVSYYDATNGDLKTAHCSNTACSSATTATLDSAGAVGRHVSITIGADGLGLVGYYDDTNDDLKVAHCSNAQCIPFVDRRPVPVVGVTAVTAGSGLTGDTLTSTGTLAVDFTGSSGSAVTVARSDHNHDTSYWKQTGNAGTNPATNFIGTTDNQALELKVNGQRALRLEPSAISPNLVAGAGLNTVPPGVVGAVIGGGGQGPSSGNSVTDSFGVVGGGTRNVAGDSAGSTSDKFAATVGGGDFNRATGMLSTISGGGNNQAAGNFASVSGGTGNRAIAEGATAGGGSGNGADGIYSTASGGQSNAAEGGHSTVIGGQGNGAWASHSSVVGGLANAAGGAYSLAAGRRSKVRTATQVGGGDTDGDEGTFVWADSTNADFQSTGPNQFLIRAGGGVGINTNQPGGLLDLSFNNGSHRLQFVHDDGLVPGINLTGTGGNLGVLRLRRRLEIWPDDAGLTAGSLDIRNAAGTTRISFDGQTGNASFFGTVSKGGGSFKIDHPLDPTNKYLYHSFVESPDMMNIYNGNVTSDERGYAVVELPAWFEALNRDFRYQLTVLDEEDCPDFAQAKLVAKILQNRFTIRTSKPRVEVSWQVTGIRRDAFAEKHRIPVEQDKPAHERGTLLYPDAVVTGRPNQQ